MNRHTISVTMPNYNHSHYIGEALEALLTQSLRPLEVIVVDDGSTDDSVAIINRFARRDPIVRLLQNGQNMGVSFSLNRALEHASGDYVCFQSADDKVLPGFFEKSMGILAQYPQAGLCCSDPAYFDGLTGAVTVDELQWSDTPTFFSPKDLAEVVQGKFILGHTSIAKRSAFDGAGGLLPELKWHCDWFASLVIGFRYGICYIPEPLAMLRILPSSYSASGRDQRAAQREVLNHLLCLLKSEEYKDVLPLFRRGGVLSFHGPGIISAVFHHPEHWDYTTLSLLRGPLWNGIVKKSLREKSPPSLKRLYRRVVNRG